jgi:hypothetical protein
MTNGALPQDGQSTCDTPHVSSRGRLKSTFGKIVLVERGNLGTSCVNHRPETGDTKPLELAPE